MKKFIFIELPETDILIKPQFTIVQDGKLSFIAIKKREVTHSLLSGAAIDTRIHYTITNVNTNPEAQAYVVSADEFIARFPEGIQYSTIKLFVESIPDLKAIFDGGVLRDFKVTQSGDDTPTGKIDYYQDIDVTVPGTDEVLARGVAYDNVKMLNRSLKYYGFEIVSELE